jgi:WD40 repeat protein
LAGLSEPRIVSVWNVPGRKEQYAFRPERSAVWSLAWNPTRPALAVGLSDGGLAIWDIETVDRQLATLEAP